MSERFKERIDEYLYFADRIFMYGVNRLKGSINYRFSLSMYGLGNIIFSEIGMLNDIGG